MWRALHTCRNDYTILKNVWQIERDSEKLQFLSNKLRYILLFVQVTFCVRLPMQAALFCSYIPQLTYTERLLTHLSGAERRSLIRFTCSKWLDMSVASTMSITSPRTSANSSQLSPWRILYSSCVIDYSDNIQGTRKSSFAYIFQQLKGVVKVVVFQDWSVIVAESKVWSVHGRKLHTIIATTYTHRVWWLNYPVILVTWL